MENRLDKLFKQKLSKQHFPIDDGTWENMESLLDGNTPNQIASPAKAKLRFILTGFLTLGLLVFAIYTFSVKQKSKIKLPKVDVVADIDSSKEPHTPLNNKNTNIKPSESPIVFTQESKLSGTPKPEIKETKNIFEEKLDSGLFDSKSKGSNTIIDLSNNGQVGNAYMDAEHSTISFQKQYALTEDLESIVAGNSTNSPSKELSKLVPSMDESALMKKVSVHPIKNIDIAYNFISS